MWKHIKHAIGWEGLSSVSLASIAFGFEFANKFQAARICFWLAAGSLVLRLTVYGWGNFHGRARVVFPSLFAIPVLVIQLFVVVPWTFREQREFETSKATAYPQPAISRPMATQPRLPAPQVTEKEPPHSLPSSNPTAQEIADAIIHSLSNRAKNLARSSVHSTAQPDVLANLADGQLQDLAKSIAAQMLDWKGRWE